jgi:hypothetical protein
MRSATDILSISTGRETILIGPLSSFGAEAAAVVLRERYSILQALELFASRPNAEEILRPHLRRWGLDPVSSRGPTRHELVALLARAAATGAIGIVRVPEVTLTFAGASLDEEFKQASIKPVTGPHLPPDLSDRMMIVLEMVPQYLEGETRMALEEAIRDLGTGVIVGAVVAWIGAHFIPGVNLAMLAFDVFFLSTEVLHALERAHQVLQDVQKAKSRAELEPAAIAFATVISVLAVNGVLGRLLKAKTLTKGVGKKGGHSTAKPSKPKKEAPKKSKDRVRDHDAHDHASPAGGSKGAGSSGGKGAGSPGSEAGPVKASIRDTVYANVKNTPKGKRPPPETYVPKAEIDAHKAQFKDGASRFMLKKNLDKYGPGQKDGTAFVLPKKEADRIMAETGGDKRKLEEALGLPKGMLDEDDLVRVDIPKPDKAGVRIPSGNEAGANDLWEPGGKLPDGTTEGVIDIGSAPPGSYTVNPIKPTQ